MIGGTFCSACRGPRGNDDVAAASSDRRMATLAGASSPIRTRPRSVDSTPHHDSIADHQTLANLATQDQHGFPSMSGS